MELDKARIEDAIVAEVASKMIGDEELYSRAKNAIEARIDKLWKDAAETQIRTAVDAAITAGFDKSYQKVNGYGSPVGEKTTVRAELEKLIAGYWNETVDRQGKAPGGYGDKMTRAEWMMTQLVAADFAGEMKQHVVNLGGALKDKLRAELHETVNRLLSEIIKVRSADDQGKNRRDPSIIDPPAKPAA